ncbi:hypothetical protein EAX61_11490 [Dokdonia sinensis]|uniref:DNA primase n=1 Tax=Dokdonia sinensis TaxID=2479847 RepID=A0A3M0G6G6_9FLAO|nr:hypothetical protein [Dokdonia sinensis]RMB57363.1 hypothetical protein EAX61_11490 [Dokdonia sinensis]
MKRVIVDYKKLTPEVLSLLVNKYPYGYDDDHVITFTNHKNEKVEAVEVRLEDTIYLVKISASLQKKMEFFTDDDYEDEDYQTPIIELPDPESEDASNTEGQTQKDD